MVHKTLHTSLFIETTLKDSVYCSMEDGIFSFTGITAIHMYGQQHNEHSAD
jgi:hypothetical protein